MDKTIGIELLPLQAALLDGILESFRIGIGFLWTAVSAILVGLYNTNLVQVYVSKERMARILGENDLGSLTKATLFGTEVLSA